MDTTDLYSPSSAVSIHKAIHEACSSTCANRFCFNIKLGTETALSHQLFSCILPQKRRPLPVSTWLRALRTSVESATSSLILISTGKTQLILITGHNFSCYEIFGFNSKDECVITTTTRLSNS